MDIKIKGHSSIPGLAQMNPNVTLGDPAYPTLVYEEKQ